MSEALPLPRPAHPVTGAPAVPAPLPGAALLLRYGLLGLPLAFAALPLYVQWPAHAASTWGLSLAVLGVLLLAVRIFDAFVDPWIGARIDRLFARSARAAWAAAGAAAVCIACGMAALMFAPAAVAASQGTLLAWAAGALVITSLGYSIAMVTHQAWAVRLGGNSAEQARWVGAREALALVGVIVASVLPSQAGWGVTVAVLAVLLVGGWLALGSVPPPQRRHAEPARLASAVTASASSSGAASGPASASPWRERGFQRLMAVVLVSGFASAIPASLVVLYVRDVLQAGAAAEGWLLGLYFLAAALGMPLWVRAVRRFGLVGPWLVGMGMAVAAFAGAAALGPGDVAIFAFICLASGLALGADLVVPPALLAGLIRHRAGAPDRQSAQGTGVEGTGGEGPGVEGLWFGWWNFAMKLTLAAAAGLALPLVQALGYTPGGREESSLFALAFCYALLPCFVKAAAAVLLWIHRDAWPWAAATPTNPVSQTR
jgi:Na+/melibiose symporter-like transporter